MKTYSTGWATFGDITKTTEEPDGSLTVEGIASAPIRDADNELVTAEAMKAALPEFLKTYPALREMHQPIAAGKVVAGWQDQEGRTLIRAVVVDAESVKKVKAGVLAALSIGGRVKKRNQQDPSIIEALSMSELSLVDRPSCGAARLTAIKAELAGDLSVEIVDAGEAEASTQLEKLRADFDDLAKLLSAERRAQTATLEKLEAAERQRADAIEKMQKAEEARDAAMQKLATATAELAKRPKGIMKAVPVDKEQDTGAAPVTKAEPSSPLDLIKTAQRSPMAVIGKRI